MPAITLLDLKLPKVDGLEMLNLLRPDYRTKLLPVIIRPSSKEERDPITLNLACIGLKNEQTPSSVSC